MNPEVSKDLQEIIEVSPTARPCVSIILPFEPKMNLRSAIMDSLKRAADKVERELAGKYPGGRSLLVIQKLRKLITELNLNTHKKSIAIYVGPFFEKVLYLDMAVEERILVDRSFEIRDLVDAKKQFYAYLVLVLSYHQSQVYLGNAGSFVRVDSNAATSIQACINDIPERVANFSAISERKEILMDKFLHHIDNNLDHLLNTYPLPLLVLGTKRIAGHFKKITKHTGAVLQYIHGNYEDASPAELRKALEPSLRDWKINLQTGYLQRVSEAFGAGKLAFGLKNVWREAVRQNGRLLVVERDYTSSAVLGNREEELKDTTGSYNKSFYLQDAVDQVIEKVLECGGEVEFVDKDRLKDYNHIALIQYY